MLKGAGRFFSVWLPGLLLVLGLGLALWAGAFTWQDRLGNFTDDSVSYLLMAHCYSPYAEVSSARAEACAGERYPPLLPWLLAIADAAADYSRAHWLVHLCLLASAAFLFLLAARTLQSRWAALGATAVFLLAPLTWIQIPAILSENLYLALSLAALWVFDRSAQTEKPPAWAWWGLGLLLTALFLTRTVGLVLGGALALAFVASRRWRGLFVVGAAAAAAGVWYLLHPPGSEISYAAGFEAGLTGALRGDFDDAKGVLANLQGLWASWLTAFLIFWTEWSAPGVFVIGGLGLLALLGALRRALSWRPEGLYLLGYLAVLAVWPFPGQMLRFVYGILPLAILLAFDFVRWAGGAWGLRASHYAMGLTCALVLAFAIPGLAFVYGRYQLSDQIAGYDLSLTSAYYRIPNRGEAVMAGALEQAIAADMRRIRGATAEDARILWFAKSYIALLTNRHEAVLPAVRDAAELQRFVAEQDIDYIYLSRLHPRNTRSAHNGLVWYGVLQGFTEVLWEQRLGGEGPVVSLFLRVRDVSP